MEINDNTFLRQFETKTNGELAIIEYSLQDRKIFLTRIVAPEIKNKDVFVDDFIYNVLEIIDFATLTGAIMVALGTHKAGLFSNNDKLSNKIISSGYKVKEHVWSLPLGFEYDSEINSLRADIKNIGSTVYIYPLLFGIIFLSYERRTKRIY